MRVLRKATPHCDCRLSATADIETGPGRRRPWWQAPPAAVVFTAALLVRLVYLVAVHQPPVAFDARRYVSVALAAPLAVTNPSLWSDSAARDVIDFQLLYADLITDEDVLWYPYTVPSYSDALNDLFFTGPVYPAFLGTVFRITPRWDFWVVRLLQGILDALSAVMIFLLMRRLVSPTGGILAAGIWSIYGPALYKIGELNTETLSVCLGLTVLFALVRAFDSRRRRWLLITGVLCALLALTKASATALIVPLVIAWLWTNRRDPSRAAVGAGIMLASMIVVMIPWLAAVHGRYGVFSVRDPSYGGANFRQANILESEGYNLDQAPADFWTYPVWREMKRHPGDYLLLYLRKFDRMWSRPSDDFRRGFPFGVVGTLWFHRVIVVLALAGLFLWPTRAGPVAWLPLAFIGYFVVLHLVMHVVSRYNLVAMPVVIGAAVVGGQWLLAAERPGMFDRAAKAVAGFVAFPLVVSSVRPSLWLLLPGVTWQMATVLFWLVGASLLAAIVWWLTGQPPAKPPIRRRVAWGAGVVLILTFLGQAIPREGHADWSVHLDNPAQQARRTITLPPGLARDSVEKAVVLLDILPDRGRDCDVVLDIGARRAIYPVAELMSQKTFYGKASYTVFLDEYGEQVTDVRRWTLTELDSVMLDSLLAQGQVAIGVSVAPGTVHLGGLTLYGDLPVTDYANWSGPGIEMTAVERYYEGGDPRVWTRQPVEFVAANSEFIQNGAACADDLSNCWGRQVGQYRLLFALLMWDGRWRYF
jgi:4-amino-4-deoxy-L-arabinose transferase-like glycosyltransferase